VAYGGLLQERRRALHAAIVHAFEALYPGRASERTGWLTLHAFRGEVWDRAVAYLERSTLPTLDGYRYSGGSSGPESAGVLWWMGDHEHVLRTAPREMSAISLTFGWAFGIRVTTNLRLAQAHHSLGEYAKAMELLRMNIDELTANDLLLDRSYMLGLPSVLSSVWLAMCLAERGEFNEAVTTAEQALGIAETGDPAYSLVVACAGLGNVHLLKGDLDRAVSVLERGLRTDPGEPVGRVWPFAASTLGAAWTGMGRVEEGLALLEQAVQRAVAIKLMANQPLRLIRLGEGHVRAGRPENAFPVAVQALELAEEQGEHGHEAYAHWLLGESWAMRHAPDFDRAEQHYRRSLATAAQLGMRPLQGHCHRSLGRLAGRRGDTKGAGESLNAARDLFRQMKMSFWLRELEAVAREA